MCKNCGQVHDYLTADEYIDFYEKRHKMKNDILGVEYKIIPLTRSKNTLRYYENWWERVYSLIKADISCLVSQNLDRK